MNQNQKLIETYKQFCLAEGSKHIASEFAVLKLQQLIKSFKVKSILEVGLGIGAIAGSLMVINKELDYWGTESNEFCLEALKNNLGKEFNRLNLLSRIGELDPKVQFDLIIIDGKDPGLQQLCEQLSSKGIIAIEGDRYNQQAELQNFLSNHLYVHCISKTKNKQYSPFSSYSWQGGLKVIFANPNFKQKLWWAKEKFITKVKYSYRKF